MDGEKKSTTVFTSSSIHSGTESEQSLNKNFLNRTLFNEAKLLTDAGNVIAGDGQIILNQKFEKENENIFKDPQVAKFFENLYEESQYECRSEFDPDFEWTKEEEKKLLRKLDWRVCLWACIMFVGLQIDRGNLAQAVSDNMLDDLKITTNDYNNGGTVFLCSFLAAELPSQLISKKIGPDRWIPMQITLWSIVAMSQAAISGKASFYATRALLGLLEGGFIPDIVLWLSYFYTSQELPIRLSYFWTTLSLTQILTSLLAFGLLRMRGIHGMEGWRWLFLIEGLITLLIGLVSFFKMPASAVQTKSRFNKKGWFTDKEQKIVVNRVLRDDPYKGDMHNREALSFKVLWNTMLDYDLWPLYIIGLIAYIPPTPISNYMTLTLKALGFSTFNTNLLTIPYNLLHIITLLGICRLSDYFKERSLVSLIQPFWILPCLFVLRFWPGSQVKAWETFAVTTILLGYPYIHAILVGWSSANSSSVATRTVSASLYNMMVQLGNVFATQIYRADDKPLYKRGNRNLIIINFLVIGSIIFTKFYYLWRNKTKEAKWNSMNEQERYEYLATTTDKGNKSLDFRFVH
ncbi:MFS general substrate transporter [Nadsonia fulvescens var. elongata DSM 6958]|uniref:MFS general substrate transporter n=1 Tax=Nadsonia fulvescens var. elongata DSM 6958 TaxID=857566 RepID=A0A1E3PQH2_9ASCO|nr:MFS general substrate transporter [Nadsonia fulvescens var. elongata DSM 6958]